MDERVDWVDVALARIVDFVDRQSHDWSVDYEIGRLVDVRGSLFGEVCG